MMNRQVRHNGFSLIETLMAAGILAVGMAMIAMAFPVGVKLASIATERPVGVVAGNEAFAKIRLYGLKDFADLNWPANADGNPATDVYNTCTSYWLVYANANTGSAMTAIQVDDQRCYPSLVPQPDERRYYWSALVRSINPISNPVTNPGTKEIQATVFVCRMLGMGSSYYDMDLPPKINNDNPWPVPVKVRVNYNVPVPNIPPYRITVVANPNFNLMTACRFFTEGCMIVENRKGHLYKVIETRDVSPVDGIRETLVLDTPFPNKGVADPVFTLPAGNTDIWVVPPAVGSSRNPCIDIVQKPMMIP